LRGGAHVQGLVRVAFHGPGRDRHVGKLLEYPGWVDRGEVLLGVLVGRAVPTRATGIRTGTAATATAHEGGGEPAHAGPEDAPPARGASRDAVAVAGAAADAVHPGARAVAEHSDDRA